MSMFRGGQGNFAIEQKIKADCTLEELLEEEALSTEVKNPSSKVHGFFNKEKVKSLLKYVMLEPKEDEHNKGHKFPFVAAEILSCETMRIHELFLENENKFTENNKEIKEPENKEPEVLKEIINQVEEINEEIGEEIRVEASNKAGSNILDENQIKSVSNEEAKEFSRTSKLEKTDVFQNSLLEEFLSFLDTNSELNYVLSGYFAKIFNFLFSKNPSLLLKYLYTQRPGLISKIIFHSNRRAIIDILPKLIQIESYDNAFAREKDIILQRVGIISEFILKLNSSNLEFTM
jgi:hypothetical protein